MKKTLKDNKQQIQTLHQHNYFRKEVVANCSAAFAPKNKGKFTPPPLTR